MFVRYVSVCEDAARNCSCVKNAVLTYLIYSSVSVFIYTFFNF